MQSDQYDDVLDNLFAGRAPPPSFKTIWESKDDPALSDIFNFRTIWSDRAELLDGFSEVLQPASEQDAAHVKSHRKIFRRLGFFATTENGDILAYWFGDDASPKLQEPPIVMITNEGTYAWQGIHLTEALYRLAQDSGQTETGAHWLAQHGMAVEDYGELGSTTQFLPDLDELHSVLSEGGTADSGEAQAPVPADPSSPVTWLLHPGSEIKQLMTDFFGSPPNHFCVWTTGTGLVSSLMLTKSWPNPHKVFGVGINDSKAAVEAALGSPIKELSEKRFQYKRDGYAFTCAFDDADRAEELYVTLASLQEPGA